MQDKNLTKGKMFSSLLSNYRFRRNRAIEDAKKKMSERHSVNPATDKRFKFVEERRTLPNGKEVIEIRLYQLIDGASITLNSDISHEIEGGIGNLLEFKNGRTTVPK